MCGAPLSLLYYMVKTPCSFIFSCSWLTPIVPCFYALFWSCTCKFSLVLCPPNQRAVFHHSEGWEVTFQLVCWVCVPAVGMLVGRCTETQSICRLRRTKPRSLLCGCVTHPRTGLPGANWDCMLSPFTMVVRRETLWPEIISAFGMELPTSASDSSAQVLSLCHWEPFSSHFQILKTCNYELFQSVNLHQKTAL